MTHRAFSRNAASSRAIPVKTMIEKLRREPAIPIFWGSAQKGMQAGEEIDQFSQLQARQAIEDGMEEMIKLSEELLALGLHKQIANRYLEPWAHMETLVTATDWENFYSLRCHKDAEPNFQALSYAILKEFVTHEPTPTGWMDWHIPYGDRLPDDMPLGEKIKIATARAARTSYMRFDGTSIPEADLALHDQLSESSHWSPFEHVARAQMGRFANYLGWMPYRKTFRNENRTVPDLKALLQAAPAFVRKCLGFDELSS